MLLPYRLQPKGTRLRIHCITQNWIVNDIQGNHVQHKAFVMLRKLIQEKLYVTNPSVTREGVQEDPVFTKLGMRTRGGK